MKDRLKILGNRLRNVWSGHIDQDLYENQTMLMICRRDSAETLRLLRDLESPYKDITKNNNHRGNIGIWPYFFSTPGDFLIMEDVIKDQVIEQNIQASRSNLAGGNYDE